MKIPVIAFSFTCLILSSCVTVSRWSEDLSPHQINAKIGALDLLILSEPTRYSGSANWFEHRERGSFPVAIAFVLSGKPEDAGKEILVRRISLVDPDDGEEVLLCGECSLPLSNDPRMGEELGRFDHLKFERRPNAMVVIDPLDGLEFNKGRKLKLEIELAGPDGVFSKASFDMEMENVGMNKWYPSLLYWSSI